MERITYYYCEFLLDGTMLKAYTDLTRGEWKRCIKEYYNDVTFRGSNHTMLFGRTDKLSYLGNSLSSKIIEASKPYHTDCTSIIENTEAYYREQEEQYGKEN